MLRYGEWKRHQLLGNDAIDSDVTKERETSRQRRNSYARCNIGILGSCVFYGSVRRLYLEKSRDLRRWECYQATTGEGTVE
jgi:hypothetical protein